jgi:two-component system, NtrC family, sensor kinase
VAHEIGHPLNLTLGGSRELARRLKADAVEGEQLRPVVDLIVRGNERIERIVANLRAYTHSESRPAERTDVAAAVESSLELLAARFVEQHITVETQLEARPCIACGPGELDQVLANLLINACQAMPEGGRIWARCWVEERTARISIRDSGRGVTEADRTSIFRPFFSTSGGTGLGLSVSNQIVRRNGGAIELLAGGPGATFVVNLPLADMVA